MSIMKSFPKLEIKHEILPEWIFVVRSFWTAYGYFYDTEEWHSPYYMWGGLKSFFIAFQRQWNTVDWLTFKAPPLMTRDIVVAKIASPGSIWVSKHLTREHPIAGKALAGKGFWQGGEATLFHTCLLNIIICIFKISSLCMILSSPSFVITTFDTHT